ncbi:hypothetical protein [Paenibacillus xylanexedens]|uniref:hypothetical protein n=1 Tax=Paenibacillus xylanexedens TaxID=528191 RepID=UPI0011A6F84C|nr:hypothetical protein [Paenibacillus xylanexedens]
MAWLESHQTLGRHRKTKRLARKLGVSVPEVIGHLHLLWWWAMDNLPDGCLSELEPEDVADEMMWTGDAQLLLDKMIEVNFIDVIDGKLYIHDWHDYIGKLVEKRKNDADRKRKSRGKPKGNPADVQRTSNGSVADDLWDGAGNSTVQYSTLPSNTTTTADELEKIEKAYSQIHGCFGLKPKDWPLVSKLVDQGITSDLIIEVMTERYKKKIEEGGKVNGFSFYTNAIQERHAQGKSTDRLSFLDDMV